MKTIRSITVAALAALVAGTMPIAEELPLLQAVAVPGEGFWRVAAPGNLTGETDADDFGAGFCCGLYNRCTPKDTFAVGEFMWFNTYFNDISNGAQINYQFTLGLKPDGPVFLYDQPVTIDVHLIPAGDTFTACVGSPWTVVAQLRGRTVPWGARIEGNGGLVQAPLGTVSAF